MTNILGIGNALVDIEYAVTDEQLSLSGLSKGTMTLASSNEQAELDDYLYEQKVPISYQSSGGAGANSIFATASLKGIDQQGQAASISTVYLCRVGDDKQGKFYLDDLRQGGVTTLPDAMVTGETTGSCMVLVTPDGERTMQTFLGTSAALDETNIDFNSEILAHFGKGDWLYIEGYLAFNSTVQPTVGKLKNFARDKGMNIAVSFADPAVVKFGRDGIESMLDGGVDVIFCNCEEAMIFTGQNTHKAATTDLLKVTKLAVVTNGSEDTLIATGNEIIAIPTPSTTNFFNTLGAGDSFAGAFLYGLSQSGEKGFDLEKCGKLASAVASQVVQQFGARLSVAEYQAIAKNLT